jgi:hypothetical protein
MTEMVASPSLHTAPAAPAQLSVSMLDLDKFNAQPLQRDPFDYLILPGFIRQGVLAAISRKSPSPAVFRPTACSLVARSGSFWTNWKASHFATR